MNDCWKRTWCRARRATAVVVFAVVLALGSAAGASTPSRTSQAPRTGLFDPLAAWRPHAPTAVRSAGPTVGPWRIEPTPNPVAPNGFLVAVSCPDMLVCESVGQAEDANGDTVALAEHWSARGWVRERVPAPAGSAQSVLEAVSCVDRSTCVAVGYFVDGVGAIRTLIERRTAAGWRTQATPSPGGVYGSGLFGVTCTAAASCVAVGTDNAADGRAVPLIVRWDGTRWRTMGAADPGGAIAAQLSGVSCPVPRTCVATGSALTASGAQLALAERWDGTGWSVDAVLGAPGTGQSDLASVWCATNAQCVAVGVGVRTDGTTQAITAVRVAAHHWAVSALPLPAGAASAVATSVSCSRSDACSAVGTSASGPLVERWDGVRWHAQSAHLPRTTELQGVSCPAASACRAVGYRRVGNIAAPVAAVWSPSGWQQVDAATEPGADTTNLLGITCPSTSSCTAVGYLTRNDMVTVPLVERRTGGAWRLQPAPHPSGALSSQLNAVDCVSDQDCTAVGSQVVTEGSEAPLAEHWNGTSWTLRPVLAPAGSTIADLRGVACNRTSCLAVGVQYDETGTSRPFAELIAGRSRTVLPVSAGGPGTVSAVSCLGEDSCTAVGDRTASDGTQLPLIATWDGTAWHRQRVPVPAGAIAAQLSAVSCHVGARCIAAGRFLDGRGVAHPLVYRGSGTSWTPHTLPDVPGTVGTVLQGVACATSSTCVAVGYSYALGPNGHLLPAQPVAETTTGGPWALEALPQPPGTSSAVLDQVSCTSTACRAAGYRIASSPRQVGLVLVRPVAG